MQFWCPDLRKDIGGSPKETNSWDERLGLSREVDCLAFIRMRGNLTETCMR